MTRAAKILVVVAGLVAPVGCLLSTDLNGLSGGRADEPALPTEAAAMGDASTDAMLATPDDSSDAVVPRGARTLLAIGGGEGDASYPPGSTSVYAAPIRSDGTLEAWTMGVSLPRISAGAAYLVDSSIVIGAGTGSLLFGTAPDGGAPAQWLPTAAPASTHGNGSFATDHTTLLALGGDPGGLAVDVTQAAGGGGLRSWTAATALPRPRYGFNTAVSSRVVVAVMGSTSDDGGAAVADTTMLYARLGPSNGLGPWIEGPSIPQYPGYPTSVVLGNHIYLVGGVNFNNGADPSVCVITVPATGMPSTCVPVAPLPSPRMNVCAVATERSIYVIGGDEGGAHVVKYATVYMATPDVDGNIGFWSTVADLPAPKTYPGCVTF